MELSKVWIWGNPGLALIAGEVVDRPTPVHHLFRYRRIDKLFAGPNCGGARVHPEEGGHFFVWGENSSGRLAVGSTETVRFPVQFSGKLRTREIVQCCWGVDFGLFLDSDGDLWGSGSNSNGCLMDLPTETDYPTAVGLRMDFFGDSSELTIIQIAVGTCHCGVAVSDGSVWMWGKGGQGQLGCQLPPDGVVRIPLRVEMDSPEIRIKSIALGNSHSLGLTEDGRVLAWGSTAQLGGGVRGDHVWTPVVALDRQIASISSGEQLCAAITTEGRLFLWGQTLVPPSMFPFIRTTSRPVEETEYLDGDAMKSLLAEGKRIIAVECGRQHVVALLQIASGESVSIEVLTWGLSTPALGLEGETSSQPKVVSRLSPQRVVSIVASGDVSGCICESGWLRHEDVDFCPRDGVRFTTIRRRRHCVACGGIFCASCTRHRIVVPRTGMENPVRVCDLCYELLQRNVE